MSKLNLKNIGVHKWNKTSEKLPPVGCYVLGYAQPADADIRYFAIVKRVDCGYDIFRTTIGFFYDTDEITYWTHLPNAPTQEETE